MAWRAWTCVVVGAMVTAVFLVVPALPAAADTPGVVPVPRVAFSTLAEPHGPNGIAVVDLDGSPPRVVTDPHGDDIDERHVSPALHPDGRHVVYVAEGPGSPVVRIRDLVTGAEATVGKGHFPVWSPDGLELAHVRHVGDGAELVVRHVAGLVTGPARVIHRHPASMERPAWSPLGDRIGVYAQRVASTDPGGASDTAVVVVEVQTGTARVVSGTVSIEPTPLSWSPSGDAVTALGRLEPGSNAWSALLLSVDGDSPTVLLHSDVESAFGARFAPDGSVVWAVAQQAGELLALSPTGGVVRRLELPGLREDDQLLISPDGDTAVLGMSLRDGDEFVADLYEVDLDTGAGRRVTTGGIYAMHTAAAHWPGLTHRVGGDDRIETVLELVRRVFDRADCVVLARADEFADALAAGPLAALLDAPLLLTPRDELDARVAELVEQLRATCAVLVGGVEALTEEVADALRDLGLTVERIAGADRFAVAAAIADRVGTDGGAYLVEGVHADPARGWPDAIAVGALAAAERRPILLTHRDHVPAPTVEAIDQLTQPTVDIVGGAAAVSATVRRQVEQRGVTVSRLAGIDRYDTSRRVMELAGGAGLDQRSPVVVTGSSWPDALSAGVTAAAAGRPLLLVDGTHPGGGSASRDWLAEHAGQVEQVRLVGGPTAITPTVATTIEDLTGAF